MAHVITALLMTIAVLAADGTVHIGQATGSSHVSAELVPIACNNDGVMLLKTRYSANQTGAHDHWFIEYGWLVVSCHWLWQERPHAVFDPLCFDSDNELSAALRFLEEEFDSPFAWSSPPASVLPLIELHGFTEPTEDGLTASDDAVAAIRRVVRSCQDCEQVQRSIRNIVAPAGEEGRLDVGHYCLGIAIVHNVTYAGERGRTGSWFDVPCVSIGGVIVHDGEFQTQEILGTDWGFESERIDGILLVSDDAVASAMREMQ